MSIDPDFDWSDLVLTKMEARLLAHAVYSRFANEDVDEEFYFAQLVAAGFPKGAQLTASLSRLTGRGWLETWDEDRRSAGEEGRPARRYYALSPNGAEAAEVLLGIPEGSIPSKARTAKRLPPPPLRRATSRKPTQPRRKG